MARSSMVAIEIAPKAAEWDVMAEVEKIVETGSDEERPIDLEAGRRAFMKAAGLGGAIAAFAGAMTSEASAASPDVDVAIPKFRAEPRISRG